MLIKRLMEFKSHIGGEFYMLDASWAQRYHQYLYENANPPGPIDNTSLH